MLKRSDLHEYQEKAVSFIKEQETSALFLGLGAGKTITTLTAYSDLLDDFAINKVLIIAPLRVAQTVWAEEAAEWEHTKGYRFSKILGSPAERLAALKRDAEFYVINRENLVWLVDQMKSKKDWKFDAIVVDESSSFKNHAAKRFKALKKVAGLSYYRTLLTATPNANSYMDLWSQFYLIDGGARLGFNISMFRRTYFIPDHMGWSWNLKSGSIKTIQNKIKDKVISASYDDLPQAVDTIMESPLTGKLHKQYLTFEKEALLGIEDGELNAVNAAVLTGKLLQFSSGAVYDEDKNVHHFHDLKLDMIDEILEFNEGENIIVVYQFQHELERLKKKYPHGKTISKDGSTINDWQAGKIPLLFIHAQGAGHGIQLQKGGHIMVFMGFTWSLEFYLQVKGRIYRQGQTKPCQFIHLAVGEVEHKLMRTLTRKKVTQQELLDALK
jgi:SNF2 family DNA or RNA helicase